MAAAKVGGGDGEGGGSMRSVDFKVYQATIEDERPRMFRSENVKLSNSLESLDKIETIESTQEAKTGF